MKIVKFYGQLRSVRSHVTGSTRVELDCGRDSFEEIMELHRFFHEQNIHVAIALVPMGEEDPGFPGIENMSQEPGE